MQWLQNPNQSNKGNLNNVRREASRHFSNRNEYLNVKSIGFETNSNNKDIRDCIGTSMTLRTFTRL
jgi:hypothetical protein